MKTYIAITLLDGSDSRADELTEAINRILLSPLPRVIHVHDLSRAGAGKEIKSLMREYNKYGVFYHRVKMAGKSLESENQRANYGMANMLLHFNQIKSKMFDTLVHITQNMIFSAHDLNLLVNNARLYNAVSPIVENVQGLEIWDAVFDRYGVTYSTKSSAPSFFISGDIQDSFTLNPKCFGLSNRYAKRLKNFTISDREPVSYLNELVYSNTNELPKIDTGLFVHENLY